MTDAEPPAEKRPIAVTVTVWRYDPEWDEPLRNGFTRGDEENKNCLRLGPFAITFGRDPK